MLLSFKPSTSIVPLQNPRKHCHLYQCDGLRVKSLIRKLSKVAMLLPLDKYGVRGVETAKRKTPGYTR
jgi:hypothetical protein